MSDTETKICKECRVEKPLGEFGLNKARTCKPCINRLSRLKYNNGVDPGPKRVGKLDLVSKTKECSSCGKLLPFSEFSKSKTCRVGLRASCKNCLASQRRARLNGGIDPTPKKRNHRIRPRGYYSEELGERSCLECGETKAFSEFPSRRKLVNGKACLKVAAVCKSCKNRLAREKSGGGVDRGERVVCKIDTENKTKECSRCREILPFSSFSEAKRQRLDLKPMCKDCCAAVRRERKNGGVDPTPWVKAKKRRSAGWIDIKSQERCCLDCGITKPFEEFPNHAASPSNVYPICKDCLNMVRRMQRNNGVDTGPMRKSGIDLLEGTKECLACGCWKPFDSFGAKLGGVGGLNALCYTCLAEERRTNPQKRMRESVRGCVITKIKSYCADPSILDSIRYMYRVYAFGCTFSELIRHLEVEFYPNPRTGEMMTWDNYGRPKEVDEGWDIDHIIALARFDLTDEDQIKEAVHFSNLQPLWMLDNEAKGMDIMTKEEARTAYKGGK